MNRIACSTNGVIWFGISSNFANIYNSVNSGASWTTNSGAHTNWSAIALSADGQRGVATSANRGIYIMEQSSSTPELAITLLKTNQVSLLWPTNSIQGVSLEQNTNLMTPNWVPVPGTRAVINTFYEITVPATNRQLFFRLN